MIARVILQTCSAKKPIVLTVLDTNTHTDNSVGYHLKYCPIGIKYVLYKTY